jgi:hypothetical protein
MPLSKRQSRAAPATSSGRVVKVEHPTGSNIFILVIDWELEESMQTNTVRDPLTLSRYETGQLPQAV